MAHSPSAELRLDEIEVRRLLHAVAPEFSSLPLTLVAEGWDNVIWRLGDALAIRIPRRALAAPLIAHEKQALEVLAPKLAAIGIRTPLPVVSGHADETFPWPWSVVPWICGTPALDSDRTTNTAWAAELASALLELHQPAPEDAPRNTSRGIPLAQRDETFRTRIADLPQETATVVAALTAAWESGLSSTPSTERVWVHGDLHPGNILIDSGRLAAIIDFGDVTAGDPAYDLAVAWMAFDVAGRNVFRAASGTRYDAETWIRARAWAAAIAVMLLSASDDRPDMLALAFSTAHAVADDITG